jgi:hypothetical protein
VRLPKCDLDALAAIAERCGVSRDEAVRQVLDKHLELQEKRDPDDRLTHISTALRYPAPPRWRKDPRTDRPLRLRLASGVTQRARAVSLRLPGQGEACVSRLSGPVVDGRGHDRDRGAGTVHRRVPRGTASAAAAPRGGRVVAIGSSRDQYCPGENAIQDAAEEARSQIGEVASPERA